MLPPGPDGLARDAGEVGGCVGDTPDADGARFSPETPKLLMSMLSSPVVNPPALLPKAILLLPEGFAKSAPCPIAVFPFAGNVVKERYRTSRSVEVAGGVARQSRLAAGGIGVAGGVKSQGLVTDGRVLSARGVKDKRLGTKGGVEAGGIV